MKDLNDHNDWLTIANPKKVWTSIPSLPAIDLEITLSFWKMLGFKINYIQTKPYQVIVVGRGDCELHFTVIKSMKVSDNPHTSLILIPNVKTIYKEFIESFKAHLGKVPHSDIPRISRKKPDATRFTLTDYSGNSFIFINYGEKDKSTWRRAYDECQSPLQKSIAKSIVFRDYKKDEKASAKTLDAALQNVKNESQKVLAEALLVRIELASSMNDQIREQECRALLDQVNLADKEKARLAKKHNVQL